MEKVVAALWAPEHQELPQFHAALLSALPSTLGAAGASRIRLNLPDRAVATGKQHIQYWQVPQQDAIVQFWMPSANARFRGEIDAALASICGRFAAWLVAESTIIANNAYPPAIGERCPGWSQATFLAFRPDLTHAQACSHWRGHHTMVAIETQANFEYVQNLIVHPLTPDAPAYDAFVEECFPLEALTDPQAFFDAAGDEGHYQANLTTMMESCGRFIDFGRIDVIPTSQFNFP